MILRGDYSSGALHTTINVQFLIPESGDIPYRVAYLLHGLHGNQGTWLDYTMLPYYGKKYNVVFVMPEAGRSFYFNQKYGRNYYVFVSEELPKICRKIFNVSTRWEDTAVMGCSMGGHGALKLALSRPDQFGFCGSISAACIYFKPILDKLRVDAAADSYRKTGDEEEEIMKDLYVTFGEDLVYQPENDISELLRNFPSHMPRPKIFATCGTEDDLLAENRRFRGEIRDTAFDFTYEEWPGAHDWYFFDEALKKTLEFWQNDR